MNHHSIGNSDDPSEIISFYLKTTTQSTGFYEQYNIQNEESFYKFFQVDNPSVIQEPFPENQENYTEKETGSLEMDDEDNNPLLNPMNESKSAVPILFEQNANKYDFVQKKEKEKQNRRDDNLRKKIMKRPVIRSREIIESMGNIKLQINLDEVFGSSFKLNRAILPLRLYEIFCLNRNNQDILEFAEPILENKRNYYYLLTRQYSFVYEKYYRHEPFFENGESLAVQSLNTIYDDEDEEFIKTALNYYEALVENNFKERTPQIKNKFLVIRKIDKFEKFLQNENQ